MGLTIGTAKGSCSGFHLSPSSIYHLTMALTLKGGGKYYFEFLDINNNLELVSDNP